MSRLWRELNKARMRRSEAAGSIERVEVRQVVDMEPFAPGSPDLCRQPDDEFGSYLLATVARIHHSVEQERMQAAVPASVHESDQVPAGERAHPGDTVPL